VRPIVPAHRHSGPEDLKAKGAGRVAPAAEAPRLGPQLFRDPNLRYIPA
jgi:hypothetical protein